MLGMTAAQDNYHCKHSRTEQKEQINDKKKLQTINKYTSYNKMYLYAVYTSAYILVLF